MIPDHWIRPDRAACISKTRAGDLSDVQLVCGAGPYELDVLVREYAGPHGIEVVGQVTRAGALHEPMRTLPLELIKAEDNAAVHSTETDDFGEFDFARQPGGAYGLRVGQGEDAPCVLVWEEAA